MNRVEFMEILEAKLSDISDSERKEAIQYYNDYFNDAGVENEQTVLDSLGSAEEVARSIREDLSGRTEGEFTETGYKRQNEKPIQPAAVCSDKEEEEKYGDEKKQKENNILKIILVILLCVVVAPIVVPVGAGLFSAIFGIIMAIIAVLGAFTISGAAIFFAGMVCVIVGIVKMFLYPLGGCIIMGIGLVLAGIGILLTILVATILTKIIPPLVNGFVKLVRWPFEKRKGR